MAIYSPDIRLNKNDQALISALAKHLIDAVEVDDKKLSKEYVSISHEDAVALLKILRKKIDDSAFIKKLYFCEHVFLDTKTSDEVCKSIFYQGRKNNGRSRVLSSAKWAEVMARLGIRRSSVYQTPTPMDNEHFLKMERKLLKSLNFHPAVVDLLMRLLREERDFLSKIRSGKISVNPGNLVQPISEIMDDLRININLRKNMLILPTRKLAAATFLLADTSVMFTTRDWTTTGTLSAISSNFIFLSKP